MKKQRGSISVHIEIDKSCRVIFLTGLFRRIFVGFSEYMNFSLGPSQGLKSGGRGAKVQYLLENRSPPLVPSASPSTFAKISRRFLDQN